MSAQISTLPRPAQRKALGKIAKRAANLLELDNKDGKSGIALGHLIDLLAAESSRSDREIYYAIQYAIYKGVIEEDHGVIRLRENAADIKL